MSYLGLGFVYISLPSEVLYLPFPLISCFRSQPLGERSCEGRNSLMCVLGFQNTALESRAEPEVTQEMPLVSSREKSVA